MRIAISGAHRVGKTSLAEALASVLPACDLLPEPYHALEEEGHEFGEMPSLDDFILQLERSIESVTQSGPDAVFDRSPLDIVAYLETHQESAVFDIEEWFEQVASAMGMLSLLVFVPVESPDRIAVPREERRLRAEVDERLADLVTDSRYTSGIEVLHVAGSLEARVAQVMLQMKG